MSARPYRKPWPMKYVALSIVVIIAIYTALTLYFRKDEKMYQPYHDTVERATVYRLRSAGYQRISAIIARPATAGPVPALEGSPAVVTECVGGLSAELKQTLIDAPRLARNFTSVHAPSTANPVLSYNVQFTCSLSDGKKLLSGAFVYVKDGEMAIVPNFEDMEGGLLARTPDTAVEVTLPARALASGNYRVTLVGSEQSKQWTLQVH